MTSATSPPPRPIRNPTRSRGSSDARHYPAEWLDRFRAFVDLALRHLTPAQISVFLILLREVGADGTARVARADIARRAGIDVGSASRAINALIGRGIVQRIKPGVGNLLPVYTPFPAPTLAQIRARRSRRPS